MLFLTNISKIMRQANKDIEKSVIPKPNSGRPRTTTYPYETLGINKSVVAGEYSHELLQRVSSSNNYYGNKLGKKFVCRQDGKFLKIWREK